MEGRHGMNTHPVYQFIELMIKQPALALCIAFAQAANLEGDWK